MLKNGEGRAGADRGGAVGQVWVRSAVDRIVDAAR